MPALKWTLRYNGQTVILSTDPLGWDEIDLTLERDEKYRGLFYLFTDEGKEFGFYCKGGGKEIIDLAHEETGSEGEVEIDVDAFCSNNYTNIFPGRINLTSWRQESRGGILYTFCSVDPRGLTPIIRNREDVEINLLALESLGGTTLIPYTYDDYDLTLHSKVLRLISIFEFAAHTCCQRFATNGLKEIYFLPNINVIQGDFKTTTALEANCSHDATFNGYLENAQAIINTNDNPVFIQTNTVTVTWNFVGSLTFTSYDVSTAPADPCDPDTCGTEAQNAKLYDTVNPVLRVYYGNDKNTSVAESCVTPNLQEGDIQFIDIVTIAQFAATSNPEVQAFSSSGTQDILLQPGDKIWAYWIIDLNFLSANGDLVIEAAYTTGDLEFQSDTTFTASTCPAIAIHEAWSRICEGISDQTLAFKSEFFGRTNSQGLSYASNGCGAFTAFSNGKNIRLLDYARHPIVMSLKEMFEGNDAIWGLSLQVELHNGVEVVRVEEADYAYQDVEIFRAPFVPKIETSFDTTHAYNEVEIGYQKWETESANGIDEPNAKAKWVFTGIKYIKSTFEAVSSFIASMYSIELTRRKIPDQTEDYKYDNDNFIFALKRDVTQLNICEKDENFVSVTNLISPSTAYNLRFNLYSNFKRLMNLFTTGLTKQTPQQIKYTSFEGNKDMTYAYTPDGCVGDSLGATVQNVQDTTYPDANARRDTPIVLPEKISFEYPVSFTEWLIIKANPRGKILFSDTDRDFIEAHLTLLSYNLKTSKGTFNLVKRG